MSATWEHLRNFTAARIALGRAGGSVPTAPLLDFRLSHARARDAVLAPFDPEALAGTLREVHPEVLVVESQARDRAEYLQRPDFGRRLSDASREKLISATDGCKPSLPAGEGCVTRVPLSPDLVVIASDGLSTHAVITQCAPLLKLLLPMFDGWTLGPLVVVRHGRVAIQDEIGGLLNAKISLMLLGERPGLGSPDSLGAYFTFGPVPGRTDADRNCVSNIRPEGLPLEAAAKKLHALLTTSRQLGLSGVQLKDDTPLLSADVPKPVLSA